MPTLYEIFSPQGRFTTAVQVPLLLCIGVVLYQNEQARVGQGGVGSASGLGWIMRRLTERTISTTASSISVSDPVQFSIEACQLVAYVVERAGHLCSDEVVRETTQSA